MKTSKRTADIIIYGGPASGKSTQAKLLAKKLSALHMNMGGLLRAEVRRHSPAAPAIKKYMSAGKLVPEKVSAALVRNFIRRASRGKRIVFDGYPRRMPQVRVFEKAVKAAGRHAVLVFIDLPAAVAEARIIKRAKSKGRVDDQDPQVVAERIRVFRKNARTVLDFYRSRQSLLTVDGDQTIAAIHRDIVRKARG